MFCSVIVNRQVAVLDIALQLAPVADQTNGLLEFLEASNLLLSIAPETEAAVLQCRTLTRLRNLLRKKKGTRSNTANLTSSSTREAKPSMGFRKWMGLG